MKSATLLVLFFACLVVCACSSSSSVSDDIVARVNGKEITAAELEKQYQSRLTAAKQAGQQLPTPEEAQLLRFQLLSQMIDDEILLQMAAASGFTATDAEVETKFTDLKSQYTEEQFQEMLKNQNVQAEDVKADLRKSLTLEKLITKEITSRIEVNQAEIKEVYEKNKESFNLPEAYRLLHILVTPFAEQQVTNLKRDDAKTPAEALAKATRLSRDIQGGLDFAIVARDWSEDAETAPNGGDWNFRSLEDLSKIDPILSRAVQRMKVGETSSLIETRFGYHIFKLLMRDPGGQKDLSSAQVQAQIRQVIFNQKEQMLRQAFSEVAHNKAQVDNYLAERLLDTIGKATSATGDTPAAKDEKTTEEKKEEKKEEPKPEKKDQPAK